MCLGGAGPSGARDRPRTGVDRHVGVLQTAARVDQQGEAETRVQTSIDTSAMAIASSRRSFGTPMENREGFRRRVRCYNCSEVGRFSMNCPLPRRPEPRQVRNFVIIALCGQELCVFAAGALDMSDEVSEGGGAPQAGGPQGAAHRRSSVSSRHACPASRDASHAECFPPDSGGTAQPPTKLACSRVDRVGRGESI